MPEIAVYEPGTPSWVDLGSPDPDASEAFYGDLFGWEAHTSPDPAAGGYTMLVLDGHTVAGLGPLSTEGDPTSWTMYVSVADADATAAAIAAAGGTVFVPPVDVSDAGRMAVCADDQGARLSIWQPGTHIGATLGNEPNTLCWTELAARDIAKAVAFYGIVFGWEGDATADYVVWKLGDRMIGGLARMDDRWPTDAPPQWSVCFAVVDCDATAERVKALAGSVRMGPLDSPFGRFAVCNDNHGAAFSIIQLGPPPAQG